MKEVKEIISRMMKRKKSYRATIGRSDTISKVFNRGQGILMLAQFLPKEKVVLVNTKIANYSDFKWLYLIAPQYKIEYVELGYPDWYWVSRLEQVRKTD